MRRSTHVAPVCPPPGCQTCFFLCAIVSKAKVQRERGCRINVLCVCPSTDFNIRPRNGPPGGAKRNSTFPSRVEAPRASAADFAARATTSEVRSTVETQPEEQIATIRRPTCALMEKLKITTGLPLDHSTDSLASRGTGGVFVDYVNKLAPIALNLDEAPSRRFLSFWRRHFFSSLHREKRRCLPLSRYSSRDKSRKKITTALEVKAFICTSIAAFR